MRSIRLLPNCIATIPDVCDQEINVDGRIWRFTFDRHLGPCWLKKDGEPRTCQVPHKRVWEEFEKWRQLWEKNHTQNYKTKINEI